MLLLHKPLTSDKIDFGLLRVIFLSQCKYSYSQSAYVAIFIKLLTTAVIVMLWFLVWLCLFAIGLCGAYLLWKLKREPMKQAMAVYDVNLFNRPSLSLKLKCNQQTKLLSIGFHFNKRSRPTWPHCENKADETNC